MLRQPGTKYKVLDRALFTEPARELTYEELEDLIDICAATLDIEVLQPKGPAQIEAKNALVAKGRDKDTTFAIAREVVFQRFASRL